MKRILLVLTLIPLLAFPQIRIYPLDGNANEIVNGMNGTLGTIPSTPLDTTDRFGNSASAYYFDGDDFIEIPVAGLLNDTFSVSAWITVSVLPFLSAGFFGLGDNIADQAFGVGVDINGTGFFHAGYTVGGGNLYVYSGTLPQVDQWYHYTVTRSLSVVKLFIDGVLIDSTSTGGFLPDYGQNAYATIGMRFPILQGWIGKVDDVRIYDYPIPDNQVAIEEINAATGVLVYPNPANNMLHIHAPTAITRTTLYNQNGQVVYESKPNSFQFSIPVHALAAGVYSVQVEVEEGSDGEKGDGGEMVS